MLLRRRSYIELEEAITVRGVGHSAEALMAKLKALAQRLVDSPKDKVALKKMLVQHGNEVLALAGAISTKKTLWQKVRGY